jgi:hypothetical protein
MVDGLMSSGDDASIVARVSRGPARDERLGFGVHDVVGLVTPVLYIVLDQGMRKLVDDSIDDARRILPRLVRRMSRKRPARPAPGTLSEQQIVDIRDAVAALAKERGVPDDKLDRVSTAVLTVLSTDLGDEPEKTD